MRKFKGSYIDLPSRNELLDAFDYDPLTGVLRWRQCFSNAAPAGTVAGSAKGQVGFRGRLHGVSRIIFKILYDEEPEQVEHRDLNNRNNRADNLRAADNAQNQWNTLVRKDNFLGVKGIRCRRGRYDARINVRGTSIYLGAFATLNEAKQARDTAVLKFHGEFGRIV